MREFAATMAPRVGEQQLPASGDTQDELTMTTMTSEEEDEEQEQRSSRIERQRLKSGRARLGTPRHGSACGRSGGVEAADQQQQLIDLASTDHSLAEPTTRALQVAPPPPTTGESELSVASGSSQFQAPPSYGTATAPPRSVIPAQPEVAPHQQGVVDDDDDDDDESGGGEQLALRNRTDSYGFLKFVGATDGNGDKDQAAAAAAGNNQATGQVTSGRVARQAPPSEGIYATLCNVQASAARVPINHVISPRASMQQQQQQWPPHSNQLQAPACLVMTQRAATSSIGPQLPPSLPYSTLCLTAPLADRTTTTTSRRPRLEQQQPHRKRRRHRSASGRTVSGGGGGGGGATTISNSRTLSPDRLRNRIQGESAINGQQQTKQTISAHCWLVDSSDDTSTPTYARQARHPRTTGNNLMNATNSKTLGRVPTRSRPPAAATMRAQRCRHWSDDDDDDDDEQEEHSPTTLRTKTTGGVPGANTVARLATILSFMSNLVRPSKTNVAGQRSQVVSCCHLASENQQQHQPYTLTAANTRAYSSSNTSAYVTGSSSMHSREADNQQRALMLQLNCADIPHSIQPSYHSYEYCDDQSCVGGNPPTQPPPPPPSTSIDRAYDLRQGTGGEICLEQIELDAINPLLMPTVPPPPPTPRTSNEWAAPASCTSPTGSADAQQTRISPVQMVGLTDQSRLARILMSDNELLSATGSGSCRAHQRQVAASQAPGLARLNAVSRNCCVTRAGRRRGTRWWASVRSIWPGGRGPSRATICTNSSDDSAYAGTVNVGATSGSYRSLKRGNNGNNLRRHDDDNSTTGSQSTLANIVALAKADRVFRYRLIASILVSLVLLMLICLLAGSIYTTSGLHYRPPVYFGPGVGGQAGNNNNNNNNNNRLSLLVDDSDYDLSWLWPTGSNQRVTGSRPHQLRGEEEGQSSTSGRAGHQVDTNLRSLLHLIDRSDRLAQFQSVMTHLTNLQLAQDLFIDVSQLAPSLVTPDQAATSGSEANATGSAPLLRPNQQDVDLATLTLLSNLHWPLVKWRHQSQRSLAANFLSFALSPTPTLSSFGGTQTIRNLLSSLILAESLQGQTTGSGNHHLYNLQQFHRLHLELKSTSYHLLMCSSQYDDNDDDYESDDESGSSYTLDLYDEATLDWVRRKFCRLLVARYKRMMLTLSQLHHNELAELHDQRVELTSYVYVSPSTGSAVAQHPNILTFLLDRLALLDVRQVAELTLTNLVYDARSEERAYELGEQLRANEGKRAKELIELLVASQLDLLASGGSSPPVISEQSADTSSSTITLYELARSVVGENAMNLMSHENSDSSSQQLADQFRSQADKLRTNERDKWHEMLVHDLISPWPTPRLAISVVQPHMYDLFLHPNLTERLVYGVNKIEFQLTRATRFVALHSVRLNIIELNLYLKSVDSKVMPQRTTQNHTSAREEQSHHQVRVRRVLDTGQLLIIELYDLLEPFSLLQAKSSGEQVAANPKARVELGELPVAMGGSFEQYQASGTTKPKVKPLFVRNQFVLSISFNKTNLRPPRHSVDSADEGVELIQYHDPFAAATSAPLPATEQLPPDVGRRQPSMKTIMLTQFGGLGENDATAARHLFPCFDEPHLRARIQLNLVHEQSQQVISNTQRRERIQYNANGDLQMTVFEPTQVELSARQLAFVVCELHNIKSITSRYSQAEQPTQQQQQHVQVQVWARFEHLSQAEYASQLVPQLLAFLQAHLEFSFPLEKLDLVGVPPKHKLDPSGEPTSANESQAARSNHLGLVWLSENSLLVDPNLISQDLLEQVSLVIARQLSRQYLGNVVAPGSRAAEQILNTLTKSLELLALANTLPDWRLDERFPVASIQQALEAESNFRRDQLASEDSLEESWATGSGGEGNQEAAVIHMLMANLLPTAEAQAGLLRRLLAHFRFRLMSARDFYHHLGEQLQLEASQSSGSSSSSGAASERLDASEVYRWLPVARRTTTSDSPDVVDQPVNEQLSAANSSTNERVVFIHRRGKHRQLPVPVAQEPALLRNSLRGPLVENLELLAETWISGRGYPLISASCHRDRLHLRQERFESATSWPEVNSTRATDGDFLWPIPLMFVSRLNPRTSRFLWFSSRQFEFGLGEAVASTSNRSRPLGDADYASGSGNKLPVQYTWFKLNHNQTSLVRVNYDERNWEALTSLLLRSHYSNHLLNPLDRANLLDDSQVLMRSGELSVGLAMNLTLYLELGERDYQPWSTVLRHLGSLQVLLNQNPVWRQYVLKLIQPISVVIGWKDDGPHLMRKLRRELFHLALAYGDEKLIARARADFKQWMRTSSSFLVPNLQELVYVAGVRYGDQQEWFHCWHKYQQLVSADGSSTTTTTTMTSSALTNSTSELELLYQRKVLLTSTAPPPPPDGANPVEQDKRQLLTALASTQNTWLLEQFLNYSLDSSKIQTHHLVHVIQILGKNPVARLYLWRFVRLNWFNLLERFTHAHTILATMILESTSHFATRLDHDEVRTFFQTKHRAQQSSQDAGTHASDQDNQQQQQHYSSWPDSIGRAIRSSLSQIEANIHWRDSIEPKLARWLSHNLSLAK